MRRADKIGVRVSYDSGWDCADAHRKGIPAPTFFNRAGVNLHELGEVDIRAESVLNRADVGGEAVRCELRPVLDPGAQVRHQSECIVRGTLADDIGENEFRFRIESNPSVLIADGAIILASPNVLLFAVNEGPNLVCLDLFDRNISNLLIGDSRTKTTPSSAIAPLGGAETTELVGDSALQPWGVGDGLTGFVHPRKRFPTTIAKMVASGRDIDTAARVLPESARYAVIANPATVITPPIDIAHFLPVESLFARSIANL